MKKILLGLLMVVSFYSNSQPSITWQKCLGGSANDFIASSVQTTDGGYILIGNTSSNDGDVSGNHGGAGNDAWIVKLNSDLATNNFAINTITTYPNPMQNTLHVELEKEFDAYWKEKAKPLFVEENNITKAFIASMETEKLKNFLKYTPFPSKKRLFTYTTEGANTESQKTLIKGLGATKNQNTNNKTWNDELLTNVYISKVKLN